MIRYCGLKLQILLAISNSVYTVCTLNYNTADANITASYV